MSLSVRDISFGYNGPFLFEQLGFELDEGELPLVILGPSGSGKTTLLKLLGGLLKPHKGEIRFFGEGGGGLLCAAPEAAFIFQEPRLLPWFTVLENVSLPLKKILGEEEAKAKARHFLSMVSLGEKEGAYPRELSGGQAQRVSMARAFVWPSPALFMDEPFQSLDIPLRINLLELCLSFSQNEKRRLIAVIHDPREAVYLARRIIVLGKPGAGIVYDRTIELSPKERSYGSVPAAVLEHELIDVMR